MNLNAARIFVRDLTEAQDFYLRKLGLPLLAGGADLGYCVFAPGNTKLVVEVVAADASPDEQALVGRFTGLSFSVTSVEDTYQELQARGVKFLSQPELQSWGGFLATLLDPAGNELQIVEYPSAA